MWEPLPLIVYGYAVHPLSPSRRETRAPSRNRLSTVTEASTDDHAGLRDVVTLEVGDEVYAFERYTPGPRDPVEGFWYRGYVVCTTRRPPVTWSLSDSTSSSTQVKPSFKAEETQQVFIGIFPASHIFIRDELADAEGRLQDLARSLQGGSSMNGSAHSGVYGRSSPADAPAFWGKDKGSIMDTVREEEEDHDLYHARKSFKLGPPPDQANSSRAALTVYPASLRSASPTESHVIKPLPPRPSLKSGDDTASGGPQPIIDEIASALREWHTLMFQYLARRDYKLFMIVRDHIEALHLGRRQLLAQALAAEETVNMRRDCVTRLVSGNLVQGLDVIVRHPTWGGLVSVDVEGEVDTRSWMSAVRMYALQVSLAYLSVAYEDPRLYNLGPSSEYIANSAPLPTPAHSAFPDLPHQRSRSRSGIQQEDAKSASGKFYHVFLDLRAFVASPCGPGETAELYFSLYKKQGTQFVTEEFCAILNHHGVLSRDPTNKIRTLFIDLTSSDLQDPIYLVCRIVRNGAMKLSNGASSGLENEGRRQSEMYLRNDTASPTSQWVESPGNFSPTSGRMSAYDGGHFRRPFGCAVLELTQLSKTIGDQTDASPLKEYTMPIFIPTNEISFSMIHQNIINNNTREFEKSSRAENLAVSVKILRGNLKSIVRENTSLLQDTPQTMRLGFPDVVFPGDARNELYIKLWCGDFNSSHTSSGRLNVTHLARGQMSNPAVNVQISVEVRDSLGRVVQNAISQGSGEPLVSQFQSMVFMRCNEPTFGELIKIQLPIDEVPQWHLFFTFRNRSTSRSKGSGDGSDRPFAFAFQPLFLDATAFVEDGSHTLVMYKADKFSQLNPSLYLSAPSRWTTHQKTEQLAVPAEIQRLAPPLKDTLTIRSSLCSTKHTQNPVLLRLLRWETLAQDKELLSTLLTKFTFVGECEIVKFLRDIFDALFSILISQHNQVSELDLLIFNALVFVLGIVQDRRFSNFQPVLDVYIEKHFNCPAAASHMIHSMNRLLANPTSPDNASPLINALKVWHYIFKFIARSRELQKAKETGMGGGATADYLETSFKRELRSHLSSLTYMMSTSTPPAIIGTQTIALQHFTSILPELARMFTTVELVSIATTFANAVTIAKGKIVIWKLIMYLQVVKGFLFDSPESRPLLIEAVVIWIKPHFGRYDEFSNLNSNDTEAARDSNRVHWLESMRLCVTIIAVMLDKLQQNLTNPHIVADRKAYRQEQDNIECLLSLLPRLLDSYREIQSPASKKALERTKSPSTIRVPTPVTFPESYPFSLLASLPEPPRGVSNLPYTKDGSASIYPSLGETAVVLLVLILSSPTVYISNFLESSLEIEGRERFVALVTQFFKVATSILENDAFPKTWMNINVLAHKVLIKIMEPIAAVMEKHFIPPPFSESQFNSNLWRECMHMLLKLLSSDQLMIEEFSPQKRRAVWRLAGDIRGDGAAILLNLWQSLGSAEHLSTNGEPAMRYGGYQHYLHSLVGHVVNLCLSHHDQLRNNAVQILYSMIVSEYHQSEHFDEIEHELVTRLDSLFMSDSKGDDISRAFFIGQLRHLFDTSDVDEQLRDQVAGFLDSVDLFLELLLSVRALPDGEEYADDRVIATLRLMNFIRRIGRDEIYIKYVHQLVNMHLQSQNYAEAALTLKLHSDLHEWDLNSFVPPMEDLGLPQQSHFHRKETLCLLILDYLGKGKAWESAIEICKELAFQHGEITFNYGRLSEILRHQAALLEHIVSDQRYYPDYYRVTFYGNFPSALREKRFIYRGYEWEKFGAFCERMLNKHPGAQLLRAAGEPPVDIKYGNDQYIQCTAVTPEPDRNLPVFTNPDVPLAVRTYYEHSAINLFSSSRQVRRTTRDSLEEVWTEKIYYTTEEAFPTVLRRSEVISMEVVEISPLEIALQEVEDKTKELAALHLKYQALAKTTQDVSTNALAMSLNSAVDAPHNTGIASYRQIFFSPDYIARNPERAGLVDKLHSAIDEQVRTIDSCLKLHGLLCPPEFIPFHETLEKFFKKNFREEIRRLAMDGMSDSISSLSRSHTLAMPLSTSQYQGSSYENSIKRSASTSSAPRYGLPSLQLGRSATMTPPLESPTSGPLNINGSINGASSSSKQTPLQRHLAHLARHGINGVSSAPGEPVGGDSLSAESPHNSFVNVGNGLPPNQTIGVPPSAASVAPSYMGSLNSFGSIRGRLSRFGSLSLSFGKKSANNS
ncbi:cytoplasmic protein [Crepidotus variabilis]|uniref:Cytoplasmic protein n=1 Tax=Crepidotus variabilis TaxID=179855 RepID=A0A9P6EHY6_9AGAR|nr:cytoplasmic protein [Crepidotus variabilis]